MDLKIRCLENVPGNKICNNFHLLYKGEKRIWMHLIWTVRLTQARFLKKEASEPKAQTTSPKKQKSIIFTAKCPIPQI